MQEEQDVYENPSVITFGPIVTETRGSGGNQTDGCSSGHYESED